MVKAEFNLSKDDPTVYVRKVSPDMDDEGNTLFDIFEYATHRGGFAFVNKISFGGSHRRYRVRLNKKEQTRTHKRKNAKNTRRH